MAKLSIIYRNWYCIAFGIFAFLLYLGIARIAMRFGVVGDYPKCARLAITDKVDFGQCDYGEVVRSPITITNLGSETLVMNNIDTNCACSGLEMEKDKVAVRIRDLTLGPAETLHAWVRLAVQGRPGEPMYNVLTAKTNDPDRQCVTIPIVVQKVMGGLVARPNGVCFGIVDRGSEAIQTVTVYDASRTFREVKSVSATPTNRFVVAFFCNTNADTNTSELGRLVGTIRLKAKTSDVESLDGQIEILLSQPSKCPDVIPVTGRVASAIEVIPSELLLPIAHQNEFRCAGRVLCRSTKRELLTIRNIRMPADWAVSIVGRNSSSSSLIISIDAGRSLGDKSLFDECVIELDVATTQHSETIKVPVRQLGRRP